MYTRNQRASPLCKNVTADGSVKLIHQDSFSTFSVSLNGTVCEKYAQHLVLKLLSPSNCFVV